MQQVYKNILILVAGFSLLQLAFKEKTIVFLIVAISVLLLSALSKRAAMAINTGWLWFGEKAGRVNAATLLFLVYYLLLTPIAFLSRIGSKDSLKLNAPKESNFNFKNHKYGAEDLRNPW
ncbi:MAG: SxtJ family membrane protein [Flavobacteriales bacterium]